MKNLSSDTAYYRQIGNAIIICAVFILFVTVMFKGSPTGQWIFSCIGVILETLVIIGLFRYKKIVYDNNTIFIKTYLTGNMTEVPFINVISIEKGPVSASYSTMRSGKLIFSDGMQTRKIRFYLAYSLYNVVNLNNFIGVGMGPSPASAAEQVIVTQKTEIDRGKRLTSALTDQFIMTMTIMVFAIPEMIYQFTHLRTAGDINLYSFTAGNWYVYVLNIGFAIYFCKDCIGGQSPAKRIFKFQVVDNKTEEIAKPFRCLIRNIFILLWPIEAIILLINPVRRLGDMVAGTKVIIADPEPFKINFASLAIVFILAYPVMPLVAYLSDKLMGR